MDLLSHPFRLTAGGRLATVLDGSDDATAEAVAGVVMTRRGERVLVPDFGISDPAYAGVDAAQVNGVLEQYGPAVRVTDVDTSYPTDTTARTVLTYADAEEA